VDSTHPVAQDLRPEPSPYGYPDAADTTDVDRVQALATVQRFVALNRKRLSRLRFPTTPKQQCFLELLPLLLHVNHPSLPGYVTQETPAGIAGYEPSRRVLALARSAARSFNWERCAPRARSIDALYLMGSTGTLTQSASSDFDLWLCHPAKLSANAVESLRRKTEAVAEWAAAIGLEMHFFLMCAAQFRAGDDSALSAESSGSTQHYLLLDEFYRTAVLIAGRAPAWWLVPPEHEHQYARYVETLGARRFIRARDYLDFGPVHGISPAEFFGATLWQLSKAVAAPYKSLLKLLLLEAYAADYPRLDLLSLRYKQAICGDPEALATLDPYVLLLDKVEAHLRDLNDHDRIELARRCFYFKTELPLGDAHGCADDWRQAALARLVAGWGWDQSQLEELDAHRNWKIERTLSERRTLVKALRASYTELSRFAREHAEVALVSERDMTVLGRKLFAVFEHKAGKIDIVNHGLVDDLSESHLRFQAVTPREGQPHWLLAAGARTGRPVAKRGWTAMELLAWVHFNGLLTPATRIHVDAPGMELSGGDLAEVGAFLRDRFERALVCEPATVAALSKPPYLRAAALVVNLDASPAAHHGHDGRRIATARSDPLSYGATRENLIHTIDYLAITSWGEALTFKYQDMDGLLACWCEHLRLLARGFAANPNPAPLYCCAPRSGGNAIARRVGELGADLGAWYTTPGAAERRRYILRGGDRYYALLATPRSVVHEFSGDTRELLDLLATPNEQFTSVSFDSRALDDDLLARIYAGNRPGSVQFYYRVAEHTARIYIVDEHGALFTDEMPFHTQASLVNHYRRFFESIWLHQQAAAEPEAAFANPATPTRVPRLELHRVLHTRERGYHIRTINGAALDQARGFVDIKVIGEPINGETVFTIYCDGMEFSTQEHGAALFEAVTQHIMSQRRSRETYPVYITDIDLSRLPLPDGGTGNRQTIHFLVYKKRIERRLNDALAAI